MKKEKQKQTMTPNKTFVPIAEIARVFGVSKRTVRRWEENGMPALDLSGAGAKRRSLRFSVEDVMQWIKSNKTA